MFKSLLRFSHYTSVKGIGFHLKQTLRDPGKIKFTHIGGCSAMSSANNVDPSEEKYFMMYRLDEIRILATCCKVKTPVFGVTAFSMPMIACCEYANVISKYGTLTFATLGFSIVAGLSLYSMVFENTIGILKYNEKKDKVMVSYIDFWGKRNNEIIPLEEWVPLCDLPKRFSDKFYVTVEYGNSKAKRKLYLKQNYIKDAESFNRLLGNY